MATADPSSAIAAGSRATGAVDARISFFTALLLFVDATPRAYRLRGSNAPLRFATSTGTSPSLRGSFPVDTKPAKRPMAWQGGAVTLRAVSSHIGMNHTVRLRVRG